MEHVRTVIDRMVRQGSPPFQNKGEDDLADKSWKAFERRMAARFGTTREGPTGDDGADFYTPAFAVQCKHRKSIPKWLIEGMCNALSNARGGRLGVLLLNRPGRRMTDDHTLVVMTLAHFEKLTGGRQDVCE